MYVNADLVNLLENADKAFELATCKVEMGRDGRATFTGKLKPEALEGFPPKAAQPSFSAEGDTLEIRINGEVVHTIEKPFKRDPVLAAIDKLSARITELAARTKPGTLTLDGATIDLSDLMKATRGNMTLTGVDGGNMVGVGEGVRAIAHEAGEDWIRSIYRSATGVIIEAKPPRGEGAASPTLFLKLPETTARWLGGRLIAALDVKSPTIPQRVCEESADANSEGVPDPAAWRTGKARQATEADLAIASIRIVMDDGDKVDWHAIKKLAELRNLEAQLAR